MRNSTNRHKNYPEDYLKLMKQFLNPLIPEKDVVFAALQKRHLEVILHAPFFCPKCNHFHRKPESRIYKNHYEDGKHHIDFLPLRVDPIEKEYESQILKLEPVKKKKKKKKKSKPKSKVKESLEFDIQDIPLGVPLKISLIQSPLSIQDKKNLVINNVIESLPWGGYKRVKTRHGRRRVKATYMNDDLWHFWEQNKTLLKSSSYSVSYYRGSWTLNHWQ
ncbi:MAG: hypothetical protein ACTSWW_08895, partial [Promethearchaeota archaeon]